MKIGKEWSWKRRQAACCFCSCSVFDVLASQEYRAPAFENLSLSQFYSMTCLSFVLPETYSSSVGTLIQLKGICCLYAVTSRGQDEPHICLRSDTKNAKIPNDLYHFGSRSAISPAGRLRESKHHLNTKICLSVFLQKSQISTVRLRPTCLVSGCCISEMH